MNGKVIKISRNERHEAEQRIEHLKVVNGRAFLRGYAAAWRRARFRFLLGGFIVGVLVGAAACVFFSR